MGHVVWSVSLGTLHRGPIPKPWHTSSQELHFVQPPSPVATLSFHLLAGQAIAIPFSPSSLSSSPPILAVVEGSGISPPGTC